MKRATLHTDGGARGNPGPAGIGYVLRRQDGGPVKHGEYIGIATNNQAEYTALIKGLERSLQNGVTGLDCFLDSELIVRQLQGRYRVKNNGLRPLFNKVLALAEKFDSISYHHVPREKNKEADRLVNQVIDQQP